MKCDTAVSERVKTKADKLLDDKYNATAFTHPTMCLLTTWFYHKPWRQFTAATTSTSHQHYFDNDPGFNLINLWCTSHEIMLIMSLFQGWSHSGYKIVHNGNTWKTIRAEPFIPLRAVHNYSSYFTHLWRKNQENSMSISLMVFFSFLPSLNWLH